jgi:hypothetical protein
VPGLRCVMHKKSLLTVALLFAVLTVQAQTSQAKKDLAAKILKLQQPAIENMARALAEQPAVELLGSVGKALPSRVAKDKQDAVAKEIQADAQKYLDDAVPLVRDRAIALAPSTIGTLLEEKFTEDELKQIVVILESPAYGKFQRLGNDMQKALVQKVIAETRSVIEPKVRTLEQAAAKRLGAATPATSSESARVPAKPAKAASK